MDFEFKQRPVSGKFLVGADRAVNREGIKRRRAAIAQDSPDWVGQTAFRPIAPLSLLFPGNVKLRFY